LEQGMDAAEVTALLVELERHRVGLFPTRSEHVIQNRGIILAQSPGGESVPEREGLPRVLIHLFDKRLADGAKLMSKRGTGDGHLLGLRQQVTPEPEGEEALSHRVRGPDVVEKRPQSLNRCPAPCKLFEPCRRAGPMSLMQAP